jgi:hypothetical protein
VERYYLPESGNGGALVVEALIRNGNQQMDVRLSRTIPLDAYNSKPESNANVWIIDQKGLEIPLHETKSGVYEFPESAKFQIGDSYQIQIQTNKGDQYLSDFVELRATPPIDSVTWQYEEKPLYGLKGLQVYLNAHDETNKTKYYRWHYTETWLYHTPYKARIYWEDNQLKKLTENLNTCWKITESTSIQLGNTTLLDKDIIYNYPLLYIDNTSNRLREKYSLNVQQYSLSEESYQYWKELNKFTEEMGTLFDPLPYAPKGNIRNMDDEDEVVIGFFDACQVQEKRIFITNLELPYFKIENPYMGCTDTLVSYRNIPQMILDGYMLVKDFQVVPGMIVYIMAVPFCVDCTLLGTNEEPAYWE